MEPLFASYKTAYPELGLELEKAIEGTVLIDAADILTFDDSKTISTRVASGNAINHFMKQVPSIFGGSADLSHSTMTDINGEKTSVSNPMQDEIFISVCVSMQWAQLATAWRCMAGLNHL